MGPKLSALMLTGVPRLLPSTGTNQQRLTCKWWQWDGRVYGQNACLCMRSAEWWVLHASASERMQMRVNVARCHTNALTCKS